MSGSSFSYFSRERIKRYDSDHHLMNMHNSISEDKNLVSMIFTSKQETFHSVAYKREAGYKEEKEKRKILIQNSWEREIYAQATASSLTRAKSFNNINHQANDNRKRKNPQEDYSTPQKKNAKVLDPKKVKIQNYKKGMSLGKGTNGETFIAMDSDGGFFFALKEVDFSNVGLDKNSIDEKITEIEGEIQILKKLSHNNVCPYYGSNKIGLKLEIFSEFATGGSLAKTLESFGPFSENVAANYTRQILLGLNHLHRMEVIHRNISCANILVESDSNIKLSDFGCYKDISELKNSRSTIGRVNYLAPEVVLQRRHDKKADIWAIGCTLLEMLSGKPPFASLNNAEKIKMKIIECNVPPAYPKRISKDARSFLDLCFKYDFRKRPRAIELLQHDFIQKPRPEYEEKEEDSEKESFSNSNQTNNDKKTTNKRYTNENANGNPNDDDDKDDDNIDYYQRAKRQYLNNRKIDQSANTSINSDSSSSSRGPNTLINGINRFKEQMEEEKRLKKKKRKLEIAKKKRRLKNKNRRSFLPEIFKNRPKKKKAKSKSKIKPKSTKDSKLIPVHRSPLISGVLLRHSGLRNISGTTNTQFPSPTSTPTPSAVHNSKSEKQLRMIKKRKKIRKVRTSNNFPNRKIKRVKRKKYKNLQKKTAEKIKENNI